jgi:hypothetical protein
MSIINLAPPVDAVELGEWQHPDDSSSLRHFLGRPHTIPRPLPDDDVTVRVYGTQHANGRVERLAQVTGLAGTDYLNHGEARQLARALIAVANEVAGMMETGR